MKLRIIFMCLVLSILITTSIYAQKIYFWTDKNGVQNATTTPPPDNMEKYETDSWGKKEGEVKTQTENPILLKREIERQLLCAKLSKELSEIAKEEVKIAERRKEYNRRSADRMRFAVKNDMPRSYWDKINEDDRIENKRQDDEEAPLNNRMRQIEIEKRVNNCK